MCTSIGLLIFLQGRIYFHCLLAALLFVFPPSVHLNAIVFYHRTCSPFSPSISLNSPCHLLSSSLTRIHLAACLFIPGANISILTTTQSSIAADLDSFEEATWFTSSYLIAMSALAPLMGRLSQVFSPRMCMFSSTILICAGSLITSLANSLTWFLVGRSLTGAGGAGILIVATIVVIQMVSAKRRGLFIGLANTGMTVGLSLGAVIAGAMEPRVGWVSVFSIPAKKKYIY